jgi:type II secretory pathway component HofQ
MLKSFGAALGTTPFDPERHNDFAEALQEIGTIGAARMHYEQALALQPGNERATAGIAFIDSPQVSEQQRTSYFISWSEDPPPQRRNRGGSCQTQATIEDESTASMIGAPKGGQTSVLKRLGRWIRPE